MSILTAGLILTFLFHAVVLLLLVTIAICFPKSWLSEPAKAVIDWLPPFLGGQALRDWAAAAAERLARKRLADERTAETAGQLAKEMEEAAMHAMLPLAEPADLARVVACPETGQGQVGVTAPEALAIADYIRKHKSRAEQTRIYQCALENAKKIASRLPGDLSPYPCALQATDHVCCVFAHRPLRCRPLHAISVAEAMRRHNIQAPCPKAAAQEEPGHERSVAQGIELGLTRALESARLDSNVYELNGALATALAMPDAAERWARGEHVFQNPLH